MAKEILFSDLGSCFGPQTGISHKGVKDKWRSIPYRTGQIRGTMLSSLAEGAPEDLCFDPGLTGWYRIYVCLPAFPDQEVHLKLSSDESFFKLGALDKGGLTFTRLEESFWRYAKMDGQQVILSKAAISPKWPRTSILSWLRFVPMTDDEVARLLSNRARQDTKNLYVTDDMHNKLFENDPRAPGFWDCVVLPYEDSDAEWLSLEHITAFISGSCPDGCSDTFAFPRGGDRNVQEQRYLYDSYAILGDLVQRGHRRGLKMSLALRMGAWGIGFPFDQCYFDYDFFLENPQWRCVMRDGVPAAAFSYAYPEVRQHVTDILVKLAATGCDAVTLIAHRGIPYVLFEEPVARLFREEYGEDPYDLPLDDPRLNAIHCRIMTDFFRQVRAALDEANPGRHVQLHLRALHSTYDNRYIGLDCEALAAQGLVDAIITYPNRYRELYPQGCILPNGRIDMEVYRQYVNDPNVQPFLHQGDLSCFTPVPDSRGIPQGPSSAAENTKQWMALEEAYGVPIYIDIMPRIMPPEELRRRALELYDAGAKRLALWDTYGRVIPKGMWTTARRLGHKEELRRGFDPEVRSFVLQELAGNNISRYLPIWGG